MSELNVKDQMGVKKVPILSVIPASSLIYEGLCMRYGAYQAPKADGTFGYGPFNWRTGNPIRASTYIDAILRHALSWWDGEEYTKDSKLPHLGHLKATAGIIIDAQEVKNFVDDRPAPGTASALLDLWRLA